MMKILTAAILGAALLANSMMARGAELGDCTELVPEGSGPSVTCRITEMYEIGRLTPEQWDELFPPGEKLNCTEMVPEGEGPSSICKDTEMQPQPTRKEVQQWEL